MSARVIRHVMVHGRVQGVGFRAFVAHEAYRRGIEGWVRNRCDGSVEAILAADAAKMGAMIEACRVGPLGARVDALHQRDGTDDEFKARAPGELFSMLPTA